MIKSLYDILYYIDEEDPSLGDDLYIMIEDIKSNNADNRLLVDGVTYTDVRVLVLSNDEDFFLVREHGSFKRITKPMYATIVGAQFLQTLAFYVQKDGRYAHVVGDLGSEYTVGLEKEVPPL